MMTVGEIFFSMCNYSEAERSSDDCGGTKYYQNLLLNIKKIKISPILIRAVIQQTKIIQMLKKLGIRYG